MAEKKLSREEQIDEAVDQGFKRSFWSNQEHLRQKWEHGFTKGVQWADANPPSISSGEEDNRMRDFKVAATFEAVRRWPKDLGGSSRIAIDIWLSAMQWAWDNYLTRTVDKNV